VAAIQSTPLFGRSGDLLGVISTHFRAPHRPNEQELRIVDMFARQASDLIEHDRLRRELKRTVVALRSASRANDEFLATLSTNCEIRWQASSPVSPCWKQPHRVAMPQNWRLA